MSKLRKARALRPGDRIGIAAPAGPVDPARIEAGEVWLRERGFEPYRRGDLLARRGYLAGDDARRAAEFMELVCASQVGAILCARGGYGSQRMLPLLDADRVRREGKALVGYSDVTTLLLWQRRCAGLMGFHGPMLERDPGAFADSAECMLAALCGSGEARLLAGSGLVGGRGEGRLTGGSLTLVLASLATPWEIDTRGAILMLEEVQEPPYRLDRMLQQLRAAGKLDMLAGVGIGCLQDCEDPRYPEPGALQVLEEILRPLGVPVVVDLPFGHGESNRPWPLGARAAINGDRGEIELLESGVAAR